MVIDWLGASWAMAVLRQKRRLASVPGTVMGVPVGSAPWLTVKRVPVSWFWGRPPSAGGLNRGSSHVPVQVVGSAGSITALACVSL